MSAIENLPEIDEELYSRQLYVLGHEAMRKTATATVLVSGMKGLGVEIAKNVILAGVKSVTLHDQDDAQWSDLSSQFYLSENDLGKNRAEVSQKHLSKLNSNVEVIPHTSELTENFLATFKVVVLTNSSLKEQLDISDFCHTNQICFVLANTKGLAGQVFCDFGEEHVVYDPSEADPASAAIKHITLGNPGLLTVAHYDEQGHCFMDGDWVMFSEIEGMTQLNSSKPRQICVKEKYILEIGDTSSFSPYQHGGIITQVKMPEKHSYKSLRACMANPKINTQSRKEMFRYRTLHEAFQALHTFQDKFGRLPSPRNQEDADMLVELVEIPVMDQEQENLIRTFAYGCMGDLSPMNSLIGGLAAQEVLKAVSGKFTPLDQWLYFDAYECLPEGKQLTEKNCAPCGSRYDGQIAVFGADFQKLLGKQKYFLVGAGAIGCELLKNFAMIGLAAGEGGEIVVTDMDIIEKSNLNRQFLFRPQDVSKQKSEVAAAAIRRMNPKINVIAQQNQVGPDTEHFYGDDFFLGLDGVASALDSFQARNYVGERCVRYLKPLLDSGTDGTKGHALVFVPKLTKTHGQIPDGENRTFPLCTLRHFPSTIQHTIQWARNQFEDLFKRRAEDTNKFLRDPTFFEKEDMETLEMMNLVKMSLQEQPHCWRDCVVWAWKLWERLFSHDILQLLYNFPSKYETSPGLPFWSGSKRCPQQLQFDYNNTTHKTFIVIASRLFAETYRLLVHEDEDTTFQVLLKLHPTPFHPRQGMHIPVTDEEIPTLPSASNQTTLVELKQELGKLREKLKKEMEPLHFEKDKDSHLDFITHAANLRAENYGISPVDKFQAKKIVGRIVPAIATTTAAVAGLTCLELYKLVWQHKDLSSYRYGSLQLSAPFLDRCQPLPSPQAYTCRQKTWSCWDRITVSGCNSKREVVTLRDICDHIQRDYDLVPQRLLFGTATLYDKENEIKEQQLPFSLTESIRKVTGKPVPKECRLLELSMVCENEELDDDLPPVYIKF
ncbi:ubiquitin-like modifier-activating enzyme 7 isoform X1 [Pantherophis guttatus]|uniref:Ubiquitin-like modifier-activating enzyme 7 isoform X1 n=1 Tax=Pantherophis guttatus TaxID=94885 RepID=A0A6P9DMS7_PANGU|nr:ubiquitin-like modifier-activating enzyme 7 isoform X1 [Pantherophis guttatus]XP_034297200.1 ubiquitin-like modifier-activating enzyme 7 isoform X1 [Pantherophis guttatus]